MLQTPEPSGLSLSRKGTIQTYIATEFESRRCGREKVLQNRRWVAGFPLFCRREQSWRNVDIR